MSQFSIPPYIYFYPSDWLQNPEVRRLQPDVKGFYIDLICQLHFTFPYGYISLLNPQKAKKLQKSVNQNDNQEVNLRVELLVSLSVSEQLKLAENIESELNKYLPYDTATISMYINKLEENNIISRTPSGFIYVRRMVKDFKRRVVAYLNGSKGGNPNMKKGKKQQKTVKKTSYKSLNNKKLQNPVNQNLNQGGYPTADPIYIDNNTGRVREERGSVRGETIHPFRMQELYDKSFSDLLAVAYSKTLTESGFEEWKRFVDWTIENNYSDLFISKYISPPDFEKLFTTKGFTKEKWKPVIEKILSTGIKPEHNLNFRIPDFIEIVFGKPDRKKTAEIKNGGEKDYSGFKNLAKTHSNGT